MQFDKIKMLLQAIAPLNDAQVEEFFRLSQIESYKRGDIIHKAGEICTKQYFVDSGIVRHFFREEAREGTVWFGFENEFTTDFPSFSTQTPSKHTIIAVTNVELLSITYEKIQYLYQKNHAWERMGRIATEFYMRAIIQRNYDLLFKSAKEKYEDFILKYPQSSQIIPLNQIADFIGVSFETLSRIRSQKHKQVL